MSIPEDKTFIEPNYRIKISDDKLLKEIEKRLNFKDINELYALSKKERNAKLLEILQIED